MGKFSQKKKQGRGGTEKQSDSFLQQSKRGTQWGGQGGKEMMGGGIGELGEKWLRPEREGLQ